MGLLKHLLFWPVTGPTFLARFSLEKVGDTVREELTNDQSIKEELLALQMRLELGEIDDDEYVVFEAELMQRLRDVRHWREEFGMGTSGGPVRVAGGERVPRSVVIEEGASPAVRSGEERGNTDEPGKGGIATPDGASVEISLDWD